MQYERGCRWFLYQKQVAVEQQPPFCSVRRCRSTGFKIGCELNKITQGFVQQLPARADSCFFSYNPSCVACRRTGAAAAAQHPRRGRAQTPHAAPRPRRSAARPAPGAPGAVAEHRRRARTEAGGSAAHRPDGEPRSGGGKRRPGGAAGHPHRGDGRRRAPRGPAADDPSRTARGEDPKPRKGAARRGGRHGDGAAPAEQSAAARRRSAEPPESRGALPGGGRPPRRSGSEGRRSGPKHL